MRVVSLLAAGTEILHALGAGEYLVGVSHECDHPPEVAELPRLTRPRIDPSRPGGEIDREIRALVAEGTSPYEVDAEALRDLRPDLIVTQDQCEVCAVSPRDLEAALAAWTGAPEVRVISLRPHSLSDVWDDFRRVGGAVGRAPAAEDLVRSCRERLGRLREATAGVIRPRTVHIEWMEPVMLGGGWSPELLDAAGTDPWGPRTGEMTRAVTWEAVVDARPEAMLVSPCGYDLARTGGEIDVLRALPGWTDLPAVRDGRAWICDGNALFNRSGPRLVESAELVAALLHGELFPSDLPDRWAEAL